MDGYQLLSQVYISKFPLDAARIFENLSESDQLEFLSGTPAEINALLLEISDPVLASQRLIGLPLNIAADIISYLTTETAVLILRRMETKIQSALIDTIQKPTSGILKQLLAYPADCAGALMDPQVVTITDDLSVREARDLVGKNATHVISYLFTLDRSKKLSGVILFSDLLLAGESETVSALAKKCEWVLKPYQRREQILNNPGFKEMHALPVIDDQSVFLGVIGYRTLRNLERGEAFKKNDRAIQDVGKALGELYWLGISGMIQGFSSAFPDKK